MACRLDGAIPLSEPMLEYCLLDPLGTNFAEIEIHTFSLVNLKFRCLFYIPYPLAGDWGLNDPRHQQPRYCPGSPRIFWYQLQKGRLIAVTSKGARERLNHRRLECLLRRRSKKTSQLRVTGLCEENPPVTGGFPSRRACNAEMFQFDYVIMWTIFVRFDNSIYERRASRARTNNYNPQYMWDVIIGPCP